MIRCANPKCPDKELSVADAYLVPNAGDDPAKVHDVWAAKEPVGHFICPRCGHYTIRHAAPESARGFRTRGFPALVVVAASLAIPRHDSVRHERPPISAVEQSSGTKSLLIGVSAVNDRVVWASGTKGSFTRTTDGGATWHAGTVPGAERLEFRDVQAFDADNAVLLSAGPADSSRIYRTRDGGATWALQHQNTIPKGFLDCMAFWDRTHGVAVGDAVDDRIFILETTDGERWTRIPAERAPVALPEEGFFAASGTCVITGAGGRAWAIAGTPFRRLVLTADFGRTWSVDTVPVIGSSVSFRDPSNGMIFGGDSAAATALTHDAGRSWSRGGRPPFAQGFYGGVYVPGTKRPTVVGVGPGGLAWTSDEGKSWTVINNNDYWSVTFASKNAGWAVGRDGRITKLSGFE